MVSNTSPPPGDRSASNRFGGGYEPARMDSCLHHLRRQAWGAVPLTRERPRATGRTYAPDLEPARVESEISEAATKSAPAGIVETVEQVTDHGGSQRAIASAQGSGFQRSGRRQ